MIEIQVSGLVLGMIIGVIMGSGTAFYVTGKVDSSRPDQFSAGWEAGKEYGQMQARVYQGDLDEKLLRDMEKRGTIRIVREEKK